MTADGRDPSRLNRVALVGPWTAPDDSRFWMALQRAAQAPSTDGETRIAIFGAVEARADNAGHAALLAEASAGRVAGVVFAAPPSALVAASFPRRRQLPQVAIMRGPGPAGMPTVYPSETAFMARAVEHFARHGRRRIALIGTSTEHARMLGEELAARGLAAVPWLLHAVPLDQAEAARACAQLLFRRDDAERPDALLISDDHLVGPATVGLVDVGIHGGLDIVGHCNHPCATASALPIRRLGYDADVVLARCLDAIAAQRAGRRPRDVIVAPVFEDELSRPRVAWDPPEVR